MKISRYAFQIIMSTSILLFAQIGHAQIGCATPDAPSIPDGSTASEQELVASVGAFKAYQEELIGFRDCLTEQEEEYGDDITDDQKDQIIGAYNSSVETEETLAGELNEAIAAFKAASG
jgi:hypothetical protein